VKAEKGGGFVLLFLIGRFATGDACGETDDGCGKNDVEARAGNLHIFGAVNKPDATAK
jgi:hypothetical protein